MGFRALTASPLLVLARCLHRVGYDALIWPKIGYPILDYVRL